MADDLARRVDAVLERFPAGTPTHPALVVVVDDGRGRRVARAAGHADPWTRRPMRTDTHVRVASNTKTVAATAALVLVDQGRLGLDDRVAEHVPEAAWLEEITVRQALGMRTGLADWFILAWERSGRPDVLDPWEHRSALERVQELEHVAREHPPGDETTYSNSSYLLVHLVLERVTGRPAPAVLADLVLRPAGLDSTHWPRRTGLPTPYASGRFGAETVHRFAPAALYADGALVSTVPDLARWARSVARGELLSPGLHEQRLRFTATSNYPGWMYGLGLARAGRWLGHDGEHPGYATSAYHEPGSGVTIATAVTSYSGDDPADPKSFALFAALAEELVPGSRG